MLSECELRMEVGWLGAQETRRVREVIVSGVGRRTDVNVAVSAEGECSGGGMACRDSCRSACALTK
jgi:hypothetical protein